MQNYSSFVSIPHPSGAQRPPERSDLRSAATSGAQRPPAEAHLDLCAIKDRFSSPVLNLRTATVEIYADLTVVKRYFASQRGLDQQRRSSAEHPVIDGDGVILSDDGGSARKQPITAFSRKSRTNMLRTLAKVRNADLGVFFTLTYPGLFHGDFVRVKRDLKVFKQRLERKFANAGYIWRLELKPRKSGESIGQIAPHFHVLLFGVDVSSELKISDLRLWLCEKWHAVVGYGGAEHAQHGADVSPIRSRAHAQRYASKYAAKAEPISDRYSTKVLCGRRWGVGGKLDLALAFTIELTHEEVIAFKRIVVRWMKARSSAYASKLAKYDEMVGFSAFGLGDMSHGAWLSLFDSTVFRMIARI